MKGLDEALQTSAAATHEALQRLASRGKDYTDNDLKDALVSLRTLEEHYVAATSRIAEAMSDTLRSEVVGLAAHAQEVGADASARAATLLGEVGSCVVRALPLGWRRAWRIRAVHAACERCAGWRCGCAPRSEPDQEGQLTLMVWSVSSAVRDLPRLREISSVLIRHGLGDVVRRAGVVPLLERAGQVLHWGEAGDIAHLEPQQRARACVRGTRADLRQTRPDALDAGGPAATGVDHGTRRPAQPGAPVSFDELLPQVEQVLGRSPFEVFGEREPFAAASIAQVHRAKLPNGAAVILKIRRPGIEAKIQADLRILTHLAHLVEQEMPETRRYLPVQVVNQLRRSLSGSWTSPSRPATRSALPATSPIRTSSSPTSTASGQAA